MVTRVCVCVCVCVCLSVCLSVCVSVRGLMPTLLHGPGVTWGSGRDAPFPLVVHYWADLQSVHGFYCYGNITRTRNVSKYMLVLALCLVRICEYSKPIVSGTLYQAPFQKFCKFIN